jgi:DNA-binding Xre family transcriptional regulator
MLYKVAIMIMKNIVKAIEKSGKTRYQIWQDTGISQTILHRIVNGGTASIETLDILCKYLGLELLPKKSKRAKKCQA